VSSPSIGPALQHPSFTWRPCRGVSQPRGDGQAFCLNPHVAVRSCCRWESRALIVPMPQQTPPLRRAEDLLPASSPCLRTTRASLPCTRAGTSSVASSPLPFGALPPPHASSSSSKLLTATLSSSLGSPCESHRSARAVQPELPSCCRSTMEARAIPSSDLLCRPTQKPEELHVCLSEPAAAGRHCCHAGEALFPFLSLSHSRCAQL
jgi:hypothetical protein